MTDVNATRFVLKGIPSKSMAYTRYGQTMLDSLLGMMRFQNLQQLMSRTVLLDGTEIVCQSAFGQNQVTIITRADVSKEEKYLLTITPVTDKYLFVYLSSPMNPPYLYQDEDSYICFYVYDPFNPIAAKRFRLSEVRFRLTDYNYKNHIEISPHIHYGYTTYNELIQTTSYTGWDRFSTLSCPFAEFPSLTWVVCIGETGIGYFQQRAPVKMVKVFMQTTGDLVDEFVIKGVHRNLSVKVDGVSSTIPYFHSLYYAVEHITSETPPYIKTVKISQSGEWRDIPTAEYTTGLLHGYIKIVTIIGVKSNGLIGIISKEAYTITYANLTTIASVVEGVNDTFYIFDVVTRKWITRTIDYVPTSEYEHTTELDQYPDRSCDLSNFYPIDLDAQADIVKTWVQNEEYPYNWWIQYLSTIYHYDISYTGDTHIKFLDSNVTNDGLDNPDSLTTVCTKHFIPTVSVCYGRHSALLCISSHTKAHQYFPELPGSEWTDGPSADTERREFHFKAAVGSGSGNPLTIDNVGGTEDVSIKSTQVITALGAWSNITTEITSLYHALTGLNFDFQKLFGVFLYKD